MLTVHELDDLIQARRVSVGGLYLDRRCGDGDPVERRIRSLPILERVGQACVGAGFHPTSGMSDGRLDVALDDAKLRERGELLQTWPPDVVLERRFRDDRHLAGQ